MMAVIWWLRRQHLKFKAFLNNLMRLCPQIKSKKETRRGEFSGSVLIKQVGGPEFILRLKKIPPHIWCRKMAIEKTTRHA